jgi:enamine deaminase RidA (YjgF/YER057c/UK114 family)
MAGVAREESMNTKALNPWKWQDQFGFSQAIDVTGAARLVFVAGQTSVDGEGNPVHVGDMTGQIDQVLDNLEKVLGAGGLKLSNVVRLSMYTTNVPEFLKAYGTLMGRFEKAGCKPATTLLGVAGLFHPDILCEFEATAAV